MSPSLFWSQGGRAWEQLPDPAGQKNSAFFSRKVTARIRCQHSKYPRDTQRAVSLSPQCESSVTQGGRGLGPALGPVSKLQSCRDTDLENKCADTKGKDGGGGNWEIGIGTYILLILYIKYITNENILYSTENST